MPDVRTLLATALERAAYSAPGPDGRMTPETAADVEAILMQGQAQPGADSDGITPRSHSDQ